MSLRWLYANAFRNLDDTRLDLSPGVNLVHGENGSGKTSILEAAYFLGSARSFRTVLPDPLIQHGKDTCLVRGEVASSGRLSQLGIQRQRGVEREVRINGEPCHRTSELAQQLPTLVLGPESVDLLIGPPAHRRRFLNWGLFHVKHPADTSSTLIEFTALWDECNRCLRQRNQILRQGNASRAELATWSRQLADLANQLDSHRSAYIERFQLPFQQRVERLAEIGEVKLEYYRGWDSTTDLYEIYEKEAKSDQKRGFTQKGFQRADVRITVNGQPATRVCSRGELKALVWSMVLAQGSMAQIDESKETLYLIDDLASEFDQDHRKRLGRYLHESGSQVLITGVDRATLIDSCASGHGKMFHVKHGQVYTDE